MREMTVATMIICSRVLFLFIVLHIAKMDSGNPKFARFAEIADNQNIKNLTGNKHILAAIVIAVLSVIVFPVVQYKVNRYVYWGIVVSMIGVISVSNAISESWEMSKITKKI